MFTVDVPVSSRTPTYTENSAAAWHPGDDGDGDGDGESDGDGDGDGNGGSDGDSAIEMVMVMMMIIMMTMKKSLYFLQVSTWVCPAIQTCISMMLITMIMIMIMMMMMMMLMVVIPSAPARHTRRTCVPSIRGNEFKV
jgi:hypothetical protein